MRVCVVLTVGLQEAVLAQGEMQLLTLTVYCQYG